MYIFYFSHFLISSTYFDGITVNLRTSSGLMFNQLKTRIKNRGKCGSETRKLEIRKKIRLNWSKTQRLVDK
jgi:hypothetical protein